MSLLEHERYCLQAPYLAQHRPIKCLVAVQAFYDTQYTLRAVYPHFA